SPVRRAETPRRRPPLSSLHQHERFTRQRRRLADFALCEVVTAAWPGAASGRTGLGDRARHACASLGNSAFANFRVVRVSSTILREIRGLTPRLIRRKEIRDAGGNYLR